MVSEETLILCFSNLGCDVSDKSVLDKCIQLCDAHNLDEESFVELWIAYTVPHSLNIDPTIDDLIKFEKEELNKNNRNSLEDSTQTVSNLHIDLQPKEEIINNVLDLYSTGESSTLKQIKRARSPVTETENDNKLRAVDQTFVPSIYTSKSNVPNRAPSTNVRGKVLLYFGQDLKDWKKQNDYEVSIVKANIPHVPKDVMYMFELISKQGIALSSRCQSFGEQLCYIWNKIEPADSKVRYVRNVACKSQVTFRTWGRICIKVDKSNGRKSVMLEGSKRPKGVKIAPIVHLDLYEIKHYSVFSGQVVAVEGVCTNGQVLVAKKLFVKGYAPLFDVPELSKEIRIYVAVGPFTPSDNLNYQPLWDLMERVVEEEPNVLILIGPVVEYTHPEIAKCTLKDNYQDFFDKILTNILQYLKGTITRLVLISSNRDVHHEPVFPTPEYIINANKVGPNTANLYPLPDPCIMNIEGLHIGVTSVDVFRHVAQQEVSNTPGMDRIGRLADHILSQATFYPVFPPFRGLNFDVALWRKYGCFERQPHILILPSDIKYYIKSVNECLVVNPERLQKYIYAKLCIRPVYDGKWNPNKVACEIAKV
ncbi:unnamed protein product [Xylocopa violacea]|uniref:DNA polymerase alpha subunit B n=1 Tax=Xylocopa violacea TaxID=135666 RepID=A0ABP1PGJ2_XYLVO